jgi:hypothetical protein
MEYGLAHNCAGVAPAPDPSASVPPPAGFAPNYYLVEAVRIATWNDAAIARAAQNPKALPYGIFIWAVAIALPLLIRIALLLAGGDSRQARAVALQLAVLLPATAIYELARIGTCHLFAKWFCAGTGSFAGVIRPLLLGSIVAVLILVPYIGFFAAAIASIAVFMMTFAEVHRIPAMQAFLLSAGVGVAFQMILNLLTRSHL